MAFGILVPGRGIEPTSDWKCEVSTTGPSAIFLNLDIVKFNFLQVLKQLAMFLGVRVYILNVYIPFRNALRKDKPVHWAQAPRLLGLGRVRGNQG